MLNTQAALADMAFEEPLPPKRLCHYCLEMLKSNCLFYIYLLMLSVSFFFALLLLIFWDIRVSFAIHSVVALLEYHTHVIIIVYLMNKASKLSRDESGKIISRFPFCVIFVLSMVALVI